MILEQFKKELAECIKSKNFVPVLERKELRFIASGGRIGAETRCCPMNVICCCKKGKKGKGLLNSEIAEMASCLRIHMRTANSIARAADHRICILESVYDDQCAINLREWLFETFEIDKREL